MLPLSRLRTNTDENKLTPVWTYFTDGSVSGYVYVPQFRNYDQIADSKQRRDNKGRYPASPVQHQTFRNLTKSLPYNAYGAGKVIVFRDAVAICDSSLVARMVPFVPNYRWSQLNGEAFTAMSTQFPEEISIANFLWELRELLELIPKFVASLSKTVAGGYLTFKFGWEPMLRDILALAGAVNRVQARLEYLKSTYGRNTRVGHYVSNCYEHSCEDEYTGFAYNHRYRFVLKSYRSDYRAGGTLFHKLEYLDGTIGLLRGLTAALGLNNPLKIIWQALPFSFIVDWLFKVGGHLARLATLQDKSSPWVVYNCTSSIKTSATIEVWQLNEEHAPYGQEPRKCGTIECELYERRVGLSIDLDVYTPSSFTPSQLKLALALAAANGK